MLKKSLKITRSELVSPRNNKILLPRNSFYSRNSIYPPQPSQNHTSFNLRNWIFVVCWTQYFVSLVSFLLYEAKSMFDYGITFYMLFYMIFAMGAYLIPTWQLKRTTELNECCERFIESRKFKFIKFAILWPVVVMHYIIYTISVKE